jgi:AraC-like DNA-binding protein
MPSLKGSKQNKVNQSAYTKVIKELLTEPCTLTHLQEVTGLHRVTLQRLFRIFRKHKLVYITDWEQDRRGRDTFAVFSLGEGKDKPKYKMTQTEIAKRYRDKVKLQKQMAPIDNFMRKQGGTDEVRSV